MDINKQAHITVLITVRHGHGTTPVCLETLYANTICPIKVVCIDIASPPSVAGYLADRASSNTDFTHLRIEEPVSRQTARLTALPQIDTEFVVLLDNNMLCGSGCIDTLAQVQAETGADVLSPIIVTQGGRVHFSCGKVSRKRSHRFAPRRVHREHAQPSAPLGVQLTDVQPERVEINFAESHCSLFRADDLRLPGVIEERMGNAHTACYAAYRLITKYRKKGLLDPAAVTSILPIAFAYDLPWLFRSYMRRDWLDQSYRILEQTLGVGPGTAVSVNMPWHVKHLKYLLLNMLEDDRMYRDDYLTSSEVPSEVRGYDPDLPAETDERISTDVMPKVHALYPELVGAIEEWIAA